MTYPCHTCGAPCSVGLCWSCLVDEARAAEQHEPSPYDGTYSED